MAYRYTIVERIDKAIAGSRYTTVEIFEDDDGIAVVTGIETTSEWEINGIPSPSVITLFEAFLETPGAAATLQSEIGLGAGWAVGDADSLDETTVASDKIRNVNNVEIRCLEEGASLFGRSKPDIATGATGEIRTFVTFKWGH